MVILIIGTPSSGKSALAEKLTLELAQNTKKYYIATMIPYGEEGQKRVEKHRNMRMGKGFETIEKPTSIGMLIDNDLLCKPCTCLLECVSNLVGNEMYDEVNKNLDDEAVKNLIVESIRKLAGGVDNLVIVTNRFPKEMDGYDDETRCYVNLTDVVNSQLSQIADRIYEHEEGEWKIYENH